MNDFGKLYYASVAFLNNQDMYGPTLATLTQVGYENWQEFWNLNPPHFHVLLLPLALMPESWSLLLWTIANVLALIVTLTLIKQELKLALSLNQKRLCMIGGLGFAGTGAHLVTGQLSFLLALPITLAWIHGRNGRWTQAGLLLGIIASIKPFLLIFLPYILLKREFKAVGTFISVFIANFLIGVAIFGIEPHVAWLQCLTEVNWHWTVMNASLWGSLTRAFAENPMFTPAVHAEFLIIPLWSLFAAMIAGAAFWISVRDSSSCATDRAFAILLFSAILISPLGWIYYLFFLLGPLTALISRWSNRLQRHMWQEYLLQHKMRTLLLFGGISGLLVPLIGINLFQPNSLATLTLGSIYFWSTLMLWGCLVVDWAVDNHRPTQSHASYATP
ncbi:MAG: hypothetical protein NPIRA01_09410 [Nitrospirales bacterium]|nr:MAG: hypothetical protein NPIRA01_09410 [Nitrospirales bacterium]